MALKRCLYDANFRFILHEVSVFPYSELFTHCMALFNTKQKKSTSSPGVICLLFS
jgi:hypothetical protein